jgi:hypothetical protein
LTVFELKRLSPDGVPAALEMAERYRLLGEPGQAESICLDVLEIAPDDQAALILLLLARTDQFRRESGGRLAAARELLPRIRGEYEGAYYAGIVSERWAKAQLDRGGHGAREIAWHGLREAMECYERAERVRPAGHDEPLLRWNACARLIASHNLEPAGDDFIPMLE